MRLLLIITLLISCSSEKKTRGRLAPETDNPERIVHDWNGDGYPETILIMPAYSPSEYRELVVFRGKPEGISGEKIFSNRNLIPHRARPGSNLKLQRDFSFHITTDSSASGRTGEVIVWKIQWRNNRFVLTGLSRDWVDKLDPHDHNSCNVDLRRGRGKKNGKNIRFRPLVVDLIDLNERFIPEICEF